MALSAKAPHPTGGILAKKLLPLSSFMIEIALSMITVDFNSAQIFAAADRAAGPKDSTDRHAPDN